MPRRRVDEEGLRLWVSGLPGWKRRALEVLVEEGRPVTTGEVLERLLGEGHETTLSALYNFLSRLERKGLVRSLKVFMTNKRAWRLTQQGEALKEALARG